jgi:hypothetical protein
MQIDLVSSQQSLSYTTSTQNYMSRDAHHIATALSARLAGRFADGPLRWVETL